MASRIWVTSLIQLRLSPPVRVCNVLFYAAVLHPDGTRIATGGQDRLIHIWDTATGAELARLSGHTDYVYALAFSPGGSTLMSTSGDHTVRRWDTVPLAERVRARQEVEKVRPQAQQLVDRLIEEVHETSEVVKRLRMDATLSEPLQRAAWHAVLQRGARGARGQMGK